MPKETARLFQRLLTKAWSQLTEVPWLIRRDFVPPPAMGAEGARQLNAALAEEPDASVSDTRRRIRGKG